MLFNDTSHYAAEARAPERNPVALVGPRRDRSGMSGADPRGQAPAADGAARIRDHARSRNRQDTGDARPHAARDARRDSRALGRHALPRQAARRRCGASR
jgi:hypothetical protein